MSSSSGGEPLLFMRRASIAVAIMAGLFASFPLLVGLELGAVEIWTVAPALWGAAVFLAALFGLAAPSRSGGMLLALATVSGVVLVVLLVTVGVAMIVVSNLNVSHEYSPDFRFGWRLLAILLLLCALPAAAAIAGRTLQRSSGSASMGTIGWRSRSPRRCRSPSDRS